MTTAAVESAPIILAHHLAELRASGLSDETIAAAGIRSEANYKRLAAIVDWKAFPKRMAPAIVFPFTDAEGRNGYARLKPDNPRSIGEKKVKYESPKGQPNQIYLPPGVAALLDNPGRVLFITEGEKKSLKATQDGFPCIGLPGVSSWKPKDHERLLPALERVTWKGRAVFIAFDSDAADKQDVRLAESRLAKHLTDRGAVVKIVRLPEGPASGDGKPAKVGLDDFLVAYGRDAFYKLLADATEPEPVGGLESKTSTSELDPGDEAKAFLDLTKRDGVYRLRFYHASWWLWGCGRYQQSEPSEIRGTLIRHLDKIFCKLGSSTINNVLDHVKAHAQLAGRIEPPAWIDDAPNKSWLADQILATKTKLVHLPSLVAGQSCMADATPRLLTTTALDFDFNPDAAPPTTWLAFLSQIWLDDSASIGTLQEWLGYLLTLDTCQQKILLLIGPKRSGKGTIARIVRELVGRGNVAGPTLASLAQNFGLAPLLGKSVAIVSDARLSNRSDQAVVVERLLSISGEDALTIDRKHLESVTCKLSTRLMLLTNELPRLSDASGALASRFLMLRMTQSFYGKEDHDLTGKLLAELPGILLWSIEGWRRLRERKRFEQPKAGAELLGDLIDLTSPVGVFVRERCMVGENYHVAVDDLFATWIEWCKLAGRKEAGTKQTFGRDLAAVVPGLHLYRPNENGLRYRSYAGIGLVKDG